MSTKIQKDQKKRNKREIYSVDSNEIESNIQKKFGKIEENLTRYNFSMNLNEILTNKKIDQEKFAKNVKISTGSISNYRKGLSEPSLSNAVTIADGLKTNINYLIGKFDCPNEDFDYFVEKLGISQKAIQTLFQIQHHHFELEEDVDIDIKKDMKFDSYYKTELQILSSILSQNALLIELLRHIKEYKNNKKELQTLEMQYKETKDKDLYVKLIDKQIEVRRNKFYANDVFNSIIEIISEEG